MVFQLLLVHLISLRLNYCQLAPFPATTLNTTAVEISWQTNFHSWLLPTAAGRRTISFMVHVLLVEFQLIGVVAICSCAWRQPPQILRAQSTGEAKRAPRLLSGNWLEMTAWACIWRCPPRPSEIPLTTGSNSGRHGAFAQPRQRTAWAKHNSGWMLMKSGIFRGGGLNVTAQKQSSAGQIKTATGLRSVCCAHAGCWLAGGLHCPSAAGDAPPRPAGGEPAAALFAGPHAPTCMQPSIPSTPGLPRPPPVTSRA